MRRRSSDRPRDEYVAAAALKKVNLVQRADAAAAPTFWLFIRFGVFAIRSADNVQRRLVPHAFFGRSRSGRRARHSRVFRHVHIHCDDRNPNDINGDTASTALNEVLLKRYFRRSGDDRAAPWGINGRGIDVETVALHENGHSLGLGHFGPPPAAVMNPVYAGIRHAPLAIDKAGMSTVWASWPK